MCFFIFHNWAYAHREETGGGICQYRACRDCDEVNILSEGTWDRFMPWVVKDGTAGRLREQILKYGGFGEYSEPIKEPRQITHMPED